MSGSALTHSTQSAVAEKEVLMETITLSRRISAIGFSLHVFIVVPVERKFHPLLPAAWGTWTTLWMILEPASERGKSHFDPCQCKVWQTIRGIRPPSFIIEGVNVKVGTVDDELLVEPVSFFESSDHLLLPSSL